MPVLHSSMFWHCRHMKLLHIVCVSAPDTHSLVLPADQLLWMVCQCSKHPAGEFLQMFYQCSRHPSPGTAYIWTVTDCLFQCSQHLSSGTAYTRTVLDCMHQCFKHPSYGTAYTWSVTYYPNIHLLALPTPDCYRLPVSMLQTSVYWYCLHTTVTDCVSTPDIHLLVLPTPELLQTACVIAPNISSGTAYTWTVTDCVLVLQKPSAGTAYMWSPTGRQ